MLDLERRLMRVKQTRPPAGLSSESVKGFG
jgi:hypothetical protein